jgi:hypothetical protein
MQLGGTHGGDRRADRVDARCPLGVGLGSKVGARRVAGRAVRGQGLTVGGQQRHDAGDVHDRVEPGTVPRPQDQVRPAHVDPPDAARVAAVEGVDRTGVHDRLTALHRALDRLRVGDIAHHCVQVGSLQAQRRHRGRHPLDGSDQQAHLVATLDQGRDGMGADIAGPTGDQNAHPAPFGATGACRGVPEAGRWSCCAFVWWIRPPRTSRRWICLAAGGPAMPWRADHSGADSSRLGGDDGGCRAGGSGGGRQGGGGGW